MTTDLSFDAAARRGCAALRGDATAESFIATMEALYHHPEWAPGYDALWDLTHVRSLVVDEEGIAAVVACSRALEPRMGRGRAAFVVPNELHQLAAALILRLARTDARERRMFASRAAAFAWLDEAPATPG